MTLSAQLAVLEASGLIRLAQLEPEIEYLFRHALIQEAAYHSLVKGNRRMLHQAVGESLESLNRARLDAPELAPVLARHFAEAGDQARALRYYTLAAQGAAKMYATGEAIHHFSRALEIAQGLNTDPEAVVDLFLQQGHALELNAQDAEALTNYEAMETWSESRGERRGQLAAMTARGTVYVKPTVVQNLARGYDLSQKALELARQIGDRSAEAKALWNLLQYYVAESNVVKALEYGELALDIARAEGLRELTAYVLTDLNKVYFMAEQPMKAKEAGEEARAFWREQGVLNMLADNLASTMFSEIMLGQYQHALALSEEAQQVSRAIGNLWNQSYSLYTVDLVHFEHGDIGRAIEVAGECQRLAEQAGFAEGINQTGFDLILIYAYMGALSRAFEAARDVQAHAAFLTSAVRMWPLQVEAVRVFLLVLDGRPAAAQAALDQSSIANNPAALKDEFVVTQLFVAQALAELALANGDHEQALRLAEDAIALLHRYAIRLFLPDLMHLKARAQRAAGRVAEAQTTLEAARMEAEDLGSRRSLWPILADLGTLAGERGDQPSARELWQQAATIVAYIAEHAGSAELSATFLRQAAVRAVLVQAETSAIVSRA